MLKNDLEVLLRVQELDTKMDEIEESKADIPKQLGGQQAALAAAQAALAAVKKNNDDLLKGKKLQELELAAKNAEIKKLQEQQYAVKDNNSYAAIKHEIQTRTEEAGKLEESIITAMVEDDNCKKKVLESANAVKAEEAKLKQLEAKCVEDGVKLDAEVEIIRKQRNEEAAKMANTALLKKYEEVRANVGGLGIAKVDGSSCQGCFMNLRPQEAIEVKRYEKVILCETCGRILYG
ncbi:MAG: C4-type zinc ribbon domain-containing protein [Candidatus Firestonebacteria bacterium]